MGIIHLFSTGQLGASRGKEKLMKYVKNKQKDIILLLCVLLVFSCGVSLLYGIQSEKPSVTSINDDEVIRGLQSFDVSGSVKKMGTFIAQLPFDQQVRILERILNGQTSTLTPEAKVELGLELVVKRSAAPEQKILLDTINKYPGVLKIPLLYIAVDNKQLKAVPSIMQYFKNSPAQLQENSYKALVHSIKQNNLKNFAELTNALGGISKDMATRLLWDLLAENKDAQFIPVLVAQKADLNSSKAGKTPLIAAVDSGNVEMVQMLLDQGALPNKFVDATIGTPLQRELAKDPKLRGKNSTIELLLREHGARE